MSQTLQSEVTGTVWKVEVVEGQEVSAEQTLLVMESMKMEIPVAAPRAGRVLQLLVGEGEAVAEGQGVVVLG
ncbi:acetyl-CoA carboxylase biotin carboxyl carrier protein subunit [Ottowia sp.]|uniref:acetyl-CoA carboxylase biotin carboxyl carrier protein subunit n=1 Tax=Ottowia sp. TaxID=1898956 RepID=UPI002CBB5F37|nr:acetyl-CoA carboxylase biotin carboxyl carrier protein subunit [Ottowia sp.]